MLLKTILFVGPELYYDEILQRNGKNCKKKIMSLELSQIVYFSAAGDGYYALVFYHW